MKMTQSSYKKYAEKKSPSSPVFKDCILAFIFGGIICAVGQGVNDLYTKLAMLDTDSAATATSITMIFLGALLTGIGVYDSLAKYAGAGTIVPITGFANSIVSPAMEFKSEGYILGMAVKMFTIAGPVIVFGITFSVLAGIIMYLFKL